MIVARVSSSAVARGRATAQGKQAEAPIFLFFQPFFFLCGSLLSV
jgi:hypothetical protein